MNFSDYFSENPLILVFVLVPVIYLFIRDIALMIQKHKLAKRHREELIASERRIEQLMKKMKLNRKDIMTYFNEIEDKLKDFPKNDGEK
ncbi:hypothetical protein DID76_02435 [Candidatus Marinamargulisbacteria bacterium SCGC AG-414-C22]|nr:hypothetical protein DID76_02435 [Candidatus Marinamargulisbacteria bacterium SCGC AG-414-C22]